VTRPGQRGHRAQRTGKRCAKTDAADDAADHHRGQVRGEHGDDDQRRSGSDRRGSQDRGSPRCQLADPHAGDGRGGGFDECCCATDQSAVDAEHAAHDAGRQTHEQTKERPRGDKDGNAAANSRRARTGTATRGRSEATAPGRVDTVSVDSAVVTIPRAMVTLNAMKTISLAWLVV